MICLTVDLLQVCGLLVDWRSQQEKCLLLKQWTAPQSCCPALTPLASASRDSTSIGILITMELWSRCVLFISMYENLDLTIIYVFHVSIVKQWFPVRMLSLGWRCFMNVWSLSAPPRTATSPFCCGTSRLKMKEITSVLPKIQKRRTVTTVQSSPS